MKKNLILIAFIIVKFILQYTLISPEYDLHRDEYLHLDQGSHLAWGYISVPPVTSWFAYLIKLLGNGVFWVKFFPALFGALTLLIVWKTIETLKGGIYALVLGSLAILVSVILRINILFQPNSFDIFFWTFLYFTLVKYIQTNQSKWLHWLGIAAGFGILSKYNIAFLIIGLIPALLCTKQRIIFINKDFYISIGIAFIIVLPNVIWQITNHFPTLNQLKALSDTQLVNVNRGDFIKEQFLNFLSSIHIIIAAFFSFFIYAPFKKYRFIVISYVITLSVFIFFKAKGYYAIGLYPILIAFGSVYLEYLFSNGWKKYLQYVAIGLTIVLCIPFLRLAFPYMSPAEMQQHNERYKSFGLLRWEDGKDHSMPQDFADMVGWSNLAKVVDSTYEITDQKENTLVMCDNYGQAGAINYYSKFKDIHAVSFNADYINWIPLSKEIKNIILVKDATDSDSARTKERPYFDTIQLVGINNNVFSREVGTKIFLLKGAKVDINKIILQRIQAEKKGNVNQ